MADGASADTRCRAAQGDRDRQADFWEGARSQRQCHEGDLMPTLSKDSFSLCVDWMLLCSTMFIIESVAESYRWSEWGGAAVWPGSAFSPALCGPSASPAEKQAHVLPAAVAQQSPRVRGRVQHWEVCAYYKYYIMYLCQWIDLHIFFWLGIYVSESTFHHCINMTAPTWRTWLLPWSSGVARWTLKHGRITRVIEMN